MHLNNTQRPDRNSTLICTDCLQIDEGVCTCAACDKKQRTTSFDSAVLAHARWDGRTLVCLACETKGFSSQDCRRYRCGFCKVYLGHLNIPAKTLYKAKQTAWNVKLVCKECLENGKRVQRQVQLALKSKDVWKCTCPGSGHRRNHIYSNEM